MGEVRAFEYSLDAEDDVGRSDSDKAGKSYEESESVNQDYKVNGNVGNKINAEVRHQHRKSTKTHSKDGINRLRHEPSVQPFLNLSMR